MFKQQIKHLLRTPFRL